jgi:hypothetical protein
MLTPPLALAEDSAIYRSLARDESSALFLRLDMRNDFKSMASGSIVVVTVNEVQVLRDEAKVASPLHTIYPGQPRHGTFSESLYSISTILALFSLRAG